MSYRSLESIIRSRMAQTAQELHESHAPALKIPEPNRVADALRVLHANGVPSASKQDDNTITVNAAEMNLCADVLARAVQNGVIQAAPQFVSAEAIPVPEANPQPVVATHEPHPPEGGTKLGEAVEGQKENETEINVGKDEGGTNIALHKRSLNDRMQNKLKKLDLEEGVDEELEAMIQEATVEELEQLDEISKKTLGRYINAANHSSVNAAHAEMDHYHKSSNLTKDIMKASGDDVRAAADHDKKQDAAGRTYMKRSKGINRAVGKLVGYRHVKVHATEEVEQIDELSYGTLKAYATAGARELAKGNPLDHRIERRKKGLALAKKAKVAKVSKAAFGESIDPVDTLRRVLKEGRRFTVDELNEAQQLDEISKRMAGDYIKAAKHAVSNHSGAWISHYRTATNAHPTLTPKDRDEHHAQAEKHHKKLGNRMRGIDRAVDKIGAGVKYGSKAPKVMAKEEAAEDGDLPFQLDEISKHKLLAYVHKASGESVLKAHEAGRWLAHGDKAGSDAEWKKATNRSAGIRKAAKKLAEEEQLDELSRGTLQNYATKAARSADAHRDRGDVSTGAAQKFHDRKVANRTKGIDRATTKMASMREDVEQIDELSKGTLTSYAIKSTASQKKLRSSSDKHFYDMHSHLNNAERTGNSVHPDAEKHRKAGIVTGKKAMNRYSGRQLALKKIAEEAELIVEKKSASAGDVEAAKKHLFKHKEADKIGKSIHTASRHYNYVQDACDHVYNNHVNDMSYEDFDKIRPHLEDTFKKHGLK